MIPDKKFLICSYREEKYKLFGLGFVVGFAFRRQPVISKKICFLRFLLLFFFHLSFLGIFEGLTRLYTNLLV